FKLRDLAFVLSGSQAQFEVSWNGDTLAIALTSGKPYTPVGSEMSSKGAVNKIGRLSNSPVYLDGTQMAFTAYNIDGNNYFKLRDIGAALNFSVEWNGARQSIEIDTGLPYRPE
ncbi:MAG: copper amine oxidase N-terminal domain-containing protein, partial [Oscillospiraceae bacterium]|nr:copper amine oxidase N-terminal domain-containing protein [Oscillospiraceae bacterium]